jgi:magnesium transporter
VIRLFTCESGCLVPLAEGMPTEPPADAVWFDLLNPSPAEDRYVEGILGAAIPTRDEMLEIETSSRLYVENGAAYMTATLLSHADSDRPRTTAVTFILIGDRLATVRYDEPRAFSLYQTRAVKPGTGVASGRDVLIGLIDAVTDRLADVLERVGLDVEEISDHVFADTIAQSRGEPDVYSRVIKSIGRQGTLLGKIQESLVSLTRLLIFLSEDTSRASLGRDDKVHVRSIIQDVRSLTEHAASLSNKITFLLDATLGLVSLQQNTIVKIFSVLAVVFMPPTLIASMYGMNFKIMPELEWEYGYPLAICLMLASIGITFAVFKARRWL